MIGKRKLPNSHCEPKSIVFSSILIFLSILPLPLLSLDRQPWLGGIYEFYFLSGFAYERYPRVQGASPPAPHPTNVYLAFADLEFAFTPEWTVDTDIEFVQTPVQDFGFRSWALQLRYLWLDDIVGDPISLTTGGNLRIVSKKSLHDVSCPYHANVDMEVNISMGKEFDLFDYWRFRIWGYGALGMANRGSPWIRSMAAIEGNYHEEHKWAIYADGCHTYGRRRSIDPNHFYGYAKVRQKSWDLIFRYGYRFGSAGTLRFEYIRRVAARLCPEDVNTFVISYLLPFSF
jgi:hypothetical protein